MAREKQRARKSKFEDVTSSKMKAHAKRLKMEQEAGQAAAAQVEEPVGANETEKILIKLKRVVPPAAMPKTQEEAVAMEALVWGSDASTTAALATQQATEAEPKPSKPKPAKPKDRTDLMCKRKDGSVRYRPGAVALQEIRQYQKSTELLMRR